LPILDAVGLDVTGTFGFTQSHVFVVLPNVFFTTLFMIDHSAADIFPEHKDIRLA
jgi:hypothetical protein